jgi:outer membrane biosynthesis protein TonB
MAFGPDGALYVSNNAVVHTPKSGEILKLTLPATGTPVTAAPAAQPSPAAKPAAPAAPAAPLPPTPTPSPATKPAAPAQAPAAKPATVPSPSALPRTGVGPDVVSSLAPVAAAGAALTVVGLGLLRRRRR